MNANLVAGAEVFRHVDHRAGCHGGRFVAGAGGSALMPGAVSTISISTVCGSSSASTRRPASAPACPAGRLPNEQQLIFNLVFLEDVRRVVFVIHEHVFFAVDIGEVHLAARQGNGVGISSPLKRSSTFRPVRTSEKRILYRVLAPRALGLCTSISLPAAACRCS